MSNGGKSGAKKLSDPCIHHLPQALRNAFETDDRVNTHQIENLPAKAWSEKPVDGKGRIIAAILGAPAQSPRDVAESGQGQRHSAQLDRRTLTPVQAVKGMTSSGKALRALIETSLMGDGRVRSFRPEVVGFIAYLIAHDAHIAGH